MILFWLLFIIIILISVILAYLSMRDFQTSPEDFGGQNSLFLIRKPQGLTSQIISTIHEATQKMGLIVTLERLFKGRESALVIYGPKKILEAFNSALDMIELEDYLDGEIKASAWEIGIKKPKASWISLFLNFPSLEVGEQIWYQLVLQARRGINKQFSSQVRVVVVSPEAQRREKLLNDLMDKSSLVKIPKPYSSVQMLDFYKKRSMLGNTYFKLTGEEIVKLWSLPAST